MKLKNKQGLWWSLTALFVFTGLMLFGLKQNASFTPSAMIGKTVPYFEGETFPIGTYKSDVILKNDVWTIINFWTSSCVVCRHEAQELQNFYQNVSLLNDETPKLISINIQEDMQTVANWQKDYRQSFPVVLDKNGHISILFGVTGTPETFLVDRKGIIRYRIAGAINTNFILHFIAWFEKNPNASEKDAHTYFIEAMS